MSIKNGGRRQIEWFLLVAFLNYFHNRKGMDRMRSIDVLDQMVLEKAIDGDIS